MALPTLQSSEEAYFSLPVAPSFSLESFFFFFVCLSVCLFVFGGCDYIFLSITPLFILLLHFSGRVRHSLQSKIQAKKW